MAVSSGLSKAMPGPQSTGSGPALSGIIGDSPAIERARRLAARAGQSESPVLIVGETGSGKELFARAMHEMSARAEATMISVNCAAIPESLIETEFFGYESGAFTGASQRGRSGVFEHADGGTLFLDELAELSTHAQAALLRVLEEGVVTRVGGNKRIGVDVRVIAAANSALETAVVEGDFRRDLYHRLCVIPLWIPALHERSQDVLTLARHFLQAFSDRRALSDEVCRYLLSYRWPGNVRELQHCVEYMVTMADGAFTVADLPPHILAHVQIRGAPPRTPTDMSRRTADAMASATEPQPEYLDEGCCRILTLVDSANRSGVPVGRRSLRVMLRESGPPLTERAIRTRLAELRTRGLIDWGVGRAGVRLTAKGRSARQRLIAEG